MDQDIERRKLELRESLQGKYAGKPYEWHRSSTTFTSTKNWAAKYKKTDNNTAEVIIRTKILYGVLISIFFLIGVLIQITPIVPNLKLSPSPMFLIIFSGGLIYFVVNTFNRKPRIIMNRDGVWTNKINKLILWEDVVIAGIKRTGSEGDFYYMVIHYFEPESDQFKVFEYRIDLLDIKKEELAFYIEKFYEKNKTATAI